LQTDSIGNVGDAGMQPSIKCNLMPRGMFTRYVSDSLFALCKYPALINDLMTPPTPPHVTSILCGGAVCAPWVSYGVKLRKAFYWG